MTSSAAVWASRCGAPRTVPSSAAIGRDHRSTFRLRLLKTTAPSAWGPNVNVAYTSFNDAFGAAAKNKSDFGAALKAMQDATVTDLKKQGFGVAQ